MSSQPKQYVTIFTDKTITMSVLLSPSTLKIKIQPKQNDTINRNFSVFYKGQITEEERKEKLGDFYESLEQIVDTVQKEKLIEVDLEKETITLLQITRTKKLIPIFTFSIVKEQNVVKENNKQNLEQINCRCLEKKEIQNQEIKKYFKIIANELIALKKSKTIKEELLLKIQQQKNQAQIKNIQLKQNMNDNFLQLQEQLRKQNQVIETLSSIINENNDKLLQNEEKMLNLESNLQQALQKLKKQKKQLFSSKDQILLQKLRKQTNQLFSSKDQILFFRLKGLEQKMDSLRNYAQIQIQKQEIQKKQKTLLLKCQNKEIMKYYNFDGKLLTKIKQNRFDNQIFFTFFVEIPSEVQFMFSVKMSNKLGNNFEIGVIDYQNYVNKNYMKDNNYSKWDIDFLKFGDSVTVLINRKKQTVYFFVDQKLVAKKQSSLLKMKKTLFPFVHLHNIEDKIQFSY